jgi:hypothetical protein
MGLNKYSSRCLAALLVAFPEFTGHVVEEPESGSFAIELTSPSGSPFWVSTAGDEITVGFDAHHVHFGSGGGPPDPDDAGADAEEAIEYIRALRGGEILIAVWSRRGQLALSSSVPRGEDPGPRSWLGRWYLGGCSVELKGW